MRWLGKNNAVVALLGFFLRVGTLDFVEAVNFDKLASAQPGKDTWGASDRVVWTTVIGVVVVWVWPLYPSPSPRDRT